MYLSYCIKSDNYTLTILISASRRISSTSECRHVQGANRQCGMIVPGPRLRQRGAQLNDMA